MQAEQSIGRRSFLKYACAGAVGAAAGCAVPLASAQTAQNDLAAAPDQIAWDEEFDVIVVGGGLAGMAASVTVGIEGNGATCLLLEKGPNENGNGNSPYADGSVLWTNRRDDFLAYLKELRANMGNTPDDVLEAFADGVAENLDWIRSLPGFDEGDVTVVEQYAPGNESACYPEYGELAHAYSFGYVKWNSGNESGIYQITPFMNSVKCTLGGITHLTESPVTALVQDPSTKEVLGVVYTSEGLSRYARATKGVIMCCGGFENNETMKADYLGAPWVRRCAGTCNEGDGIVMCARAGAAMWHMNSCAGFWNSMAPIDGDTALMVTAKEFGITVGVNGRRYYMDWDMGVANDWDSIPTSTLATSVGVRHGHFQFGGEWPHLPMPEKSWYILDQNGYEGLLAHKYMNIMFDPIADGYGFCADTLEGLAQVIDVPFDELSKTVTFWNECCADGEDMAFHRPASTLNPIEKGPFYAMFNVPAIINTDGGPVRSPKGEILDLDGYPIPHLYSAGEFGSVWSNMYQGGGNLGECLAFGRISARNCLGVA